MVFFLAREPKLDTDYHLAVNLLWTYLGTMLQKVKKHSKKCEIMLIIQRDMHHIGCLTVSEIKILVHLEKPFFKILSKILLSTTVKI